MSRFLIIIAIILIAAAGWWYFIKPQGVTSTEVAQIKTAGKLVVATDATYPPLEYQNEKGEMVGFDIDLAREIANDLNVSLELRNVSFDKIFDVLKNGEVDLVISSVTITSEREKEMDFSNPYLNAGQVIVVKEGNSDIGGVTDLEAKKVGVQKDTTSETEALKYSEPGNVKKYLDYTPAKADLLAGRIDAIVIDYPAGVAMAQASGGLISVVGKPFTSEFYGVTLAKGQTALTNAVNNTIARLKRTGRLGELENVWFKK